MLPLVFSPILLNIAATGVMPARQGLQQAPKKLFHQCRWDRGHAVKRKALSG